MFFIPALLLSLLYVSGPASSSRMIGDWRTPSNSVVRVYACDQGDYLCVRLEALGPKNAPHTDVKNPNASLRSRSLCDLTIATGFKPSGPKHAQDGHIYDPVSGHTYSAKMRMKGNQLRLRGYIGFALFGRTEIWHRVQPSEVQKCNPAGS